MLHTESHCKRFRRHGKLLPVQHGKSISGTVPRCQYHLLTGEHFRVIHLYSCDLPVLCKDLRHLTMKSDFPTHTQYFFPHAFYHFAQDIRTNMGLGLIKNCRISTVLYESFQYFRISAVFVLYQSIQFTIRKSSGTAFSKLHIGIRL